MAENYTLTYSEGSKGWPSFYTYFPEMIKGMNQYLYTFKGGNLYSHNTNEIRNNYYGIQYNSTISTIFNTKPLEVKLFKLSFSNKEALLTKPVSYTHLTLPTKA